MWKIECNVTKTSITPLGIKPERLERINGVKINNKKLKITSSTKILGFTLNKNKYKALHINQIVSKAKTSLIKLYRFRYNRSLSRPVYK